MKRILAFVMMLAMVLAMGAFSATAADGAVLAVDCGAAAKPGDTVTVNVALTTNPGIAGMTLEIDYDSDALTLVSTANGTLFGTFVGVDESTVGSDPFRISVVNNGNVTATGTVAVLTFTVNAAAAEGAYEIKASAVKAANMNEQAVDVAAAAGSLAVEKSTILNGDVNGNGKVDLSDALRLMRYLNGHNVEIVVENSDVNRNGKGPNLADALYLLQALNGWHEL